MKKIVLSILSAVLCYSCQQISDSNRHISTTPLDTITTAPIAGIPSPDVYESTFFKGTTMKAGDTTVSFFALTMGKVKISSGRVVICDPLHIDEYALPFTYTFPKGEFPVQLSVLQAGTEEVVAFARIKFSDKPVVRWQQAFRDEPTEPAFGDDSHPDTYCVDGGIAIFLDHEASKKLELPVAANFDGPINNAMYKNHRIGWRFAIYDFDKYNLAAFTTGLGDGCYKSYIGFDAEGKPCRLLTDFGLMNGKE